MQSLSRVYGESTESLIAKAKSKRGFQRLRSIFSNEIFINRLFSITFYGYDKHIGQCTYLWSQKIKNFSKRPQSHHVLSEIPTL
jgi:hypothetical protein